MKVSIMYHTVTVKIFCGSVTSAVQYSFRLFHAMSCLYSYSQDQEHVIHGHVTQGGVTTVKYVSTLKGMLYLLKEGTSFFDTPGCSSKWVDRPLPSLCTDPLPVPTIIGPRFSIFFFRHPHFNVTQLTVAYIRTTVYGKLSFSSNTAMHLLCIQDEQNRVRITDTLTVS